MPDIRHIETVRVQPDIAPDDAGPGFSDMLSAGAGAQGLLYGTRPDETGLELREAGAGFGLRDRGAVAGSGVLDAPGRLILTEMDGDLRMHDVRRSMRTWAAKQGYGHEASEAALAHLCSVTLLRWRISSTIMPKRVAR